jgi:hypothetical protein
MGKLKQLVIDIESAEIDFVMHCYGSFLEYCAKNRHVPNTWRDAIDAIHWSAYFERKTTANSFTDRTHPHPTDGESL